MTNSLLGIDFGFKRIGLATGQTITGSTSSLHTLPNERNYTNWNGLNKIIQEWQPDIFVLGLPVHQDGTNNDVTKAVYKFAIELKQRYNKPIHFQDEYLSSSEAKNILQQQRVNNIRKKKVQKGDIDKLAAALILQRWLENNT